jgi:hypothetical protein
MERLKGQDDHHVAALHVGDSRTTGGVAVTLETLEQAVFLENGVQMPNKNETLSACPCPLREEMAAALDGLVEGDPACVESDFVELGPIDLADLPDSFGVQASAVDVDRALEERNGFFEVLMDVVFDRLFFGTKVLSRTDDRQSDERRSQV